MEFLTKTVFFVLFGLTVLLVIFFIASSMSDLMSPTRKASEALIMFIGGCVVGAGLFMAYQQGYVQQHFVRGSIILVIAFLVAVICVLIGLFFFNGPVHWQ